MGAEAVAKYRTQSAQNLTCAVLEDAKSVVSREFYHFQSLCLLQFAAALWICVPS